MAAKKATMTTTISSAKQVTSLRSAVRVVDAKTVLTI